MTFETLYLALVVVSFSTFALILGGAGIWCALDKASARK